MGAALVALLLVAPAWAADSEETLREQALALTAEQAGPPPYPPGTTFNVPDGPLVDNPLFIGVDNTTVPAYVGDLVGNWTQAFLGWEVWGAAYDPDNDRVFFNSGSMLYEWQVGAGLVVQLGTIVDGGGAAQSMVGLAFYDGTLYGTKNISNEAIWAIDTATLVATVFIDYVDGDLDCGGLSADPNTGTFYCSNDDSTPYGAGLMIINPDASVTPVAAYPAGQTDIDGLAVGDNGFAYLVIDEPGDIFVVDLASGTYATPFPNPWTSAEVFSGGAWFPDLGGGGGTYCNAPALAIPDNDPLGISTDIVIPDALTIAELEIFFDASHTWTGDVIATLTHVDTGTTVTFIDRPGIPASTFGCSANDYLVLVDDEGGDTCIEDQCGSTPPAITGIAPGGDPCSTSLLAAFDGEDASGTWTLTVSDNASGDTGTINEWCVVVNGGTVNPAITLDKTVGTDPLTCATTDEITVAAGTEVYYCYEVSNTGDVALELHDLDDDQLGSILNDFAFTLDPGVTINTVDAGLTISATIATTTVNTATWRAFTPGGPSAEATDSATVNVIFPDIDVTPASLASSQLVGTTTQQVLTIANTGQATLDWLIDEAPPNAPTQHFPQMPNPSGYGGPAPAAEVEGEVGEIERVEKDYGPPTMWEAPQVVLYDNGPLVTHPGGGAGGADASALQTALGLTLYGFGHQVSAGNRMADDFTVTDANWTIETITFFAYQTGSTTTSTITAVNLQIWDGPPNDPGSTVVWGDPTTNVLTSSTWSNIYRVLDTGLTDSARPIMANTVTVNAVLPAGTYWLDWQSDGTLTSGPWAPPISILGQTTTGDALQFTPAGGWAAAVDGSSPQGLPFIIEGTSSNCYSPSDIPWLSASPTAGSTPAAGSSNVDVTFDATVVPVGIYDALLCVFSNDPDEPLVEVPVQMEVVIPVELMGIEIE